MQKIEIPLKKTKILLTLGGSVLFVAVGIYFLTTLYNQQTRFSPILVKGAGIACIVFFSATGILSIKKMFDKTSGLIIDENGIFDNTHAISVGLIKWADITGIRTEQIASTKFILIYTTNPEFYLNKATGFTRKLMEANNNMYGTPLSLTSTLLNCNFDDLEQLIINNLTAQHK